jgi:hypothetical protein
LGGFWRLSLSDVELLRLGVGELSWKDPPRRLDPEVDLWEGLWEEFEEEEVPWGLEPELVEGEELRRKEPPRERPPLLRADAAGVSKEIAPEGDGFGVREISPKNTKAIATDSQTGNLRFIFNTYFEGDYFSEYKAVSFIA